MLINATLYYGTIRHPDGNTTYRAESVAAMHSLTHPKAIKDISLPGSVKHIILI